MNSRRLLSNMGSAPEAVAANNEGCSRRFRWSVCPNNDTTSGRGESLLRCYFDPAHDRKVSKTAITALQKGSPPLVKQRTCAH
jgi:hypothetical protein